MSLELGEAVGEVRGGNVGRRQPVRASSSSPAMVGGGGRGKREGSRDGGGSGPIYRLEGFEAKQVRSGEG